ncbi:MAG TPA: DinB family protein [Vicinamibacterales bacterium]|nr:DinB family protein [Vicinamibacterales bacterium]
MSAATTKSETVAPAAASLLTRILNEGYGPGAWHGADLKAALADVSDAHAYTRPAPGRHNIAEIAIHHAFYARSVRERLTGTTVEPFVFKGEDWFAIDSASVMPWKKIVSTVDTLQKKLADTVADVASGKVKSPLSASEQLDVVLGIACHAIYHAAQIQLVRKLVD